VCNLYRKETLLEGRDYFLDDDGREDGLLAVAECLMRRFGCRTDADNLDWTPKLGDTRCLNPLDANAYNTFSFERWETLIRERFFEYGCLGELSAEDVQKILEEAATLAEERLRDSLGFPPTDHSESESESEDGDT